MNSEQTYYTGKEVAEMLGVTTRTIRNYLKEGKLKGTKFGGRWNFTQADIDDYIQQEEQQYKSIEKQGFKDLDNLMIEIIQIFTNAHLLEKGIENILTLMNQLILDKPEYQYRFFYKRIGETQAVFNFNSRLSGFSLLSESIAQVLKD